MQFVFGLLLVLPLAACGGGGDGGGSADIEVTNLNDAGEGSLRQALADAPPGGTIAFQSGLAGVIGLTSAGLSINADVVIRGPGSSVIDVDGQGLFRVLDVTSGRQVAISDLTIRRGTGSGGGIRTVQAT